MVQYIPNQNFEVVRERGKGELENEELFINWVLPLHLPLIIIYMGERAC